MDTKLTILLIDDEQPIVASMAKFLKTTTPHCIIGCNDAIDAIDIIKNIDVDIIFSDINMPKLTGLELLKIIRGIPKCDETSIIMMTGFSTKESAISALKSGATDYLEKPFSYEELLIIINRIVHERELKQENDLLKQIDSENQWFLEIMSVISHELKTPLTIISGNTSIMLEEILGKINEKQKKSLIAISNGCKRLTRIIDTYFDYKKLASPKETRHTVNYSDILSSFTEVITKELTLLRGNIKFKTEIQLPDNPLVHIDDSQFAEIVLKELVINSCRNTLNGTIYLKAWANNTQVFTSIIDNGCGIADEFKDNIFHPGKSGKKTTLHSSVTDMPYEYGKSGYYIGLARAKKFLGFFGGEISFVSKPHEETVFTVSLPRFSETESES